MTKNDKYLIESFIENVVKDELIKTQIKNLYKLQINRNKTYKYEVVMFLLFILNISEKKITDFNWKQLCSLHNNNLWTQLSNETDLFNKLGLTHIIEKMINYYNSKANALGFKYYKELINNFYRVLMESNCFSEYPNIREMSQYKDLLVLDKKLQIQKMNISNEMDWVFKTIISNYPVNSNHKEIIQQKFDKVNFLTRTKNEFINKQLTLFLEYFEGETINIFEMKIFIYYFFDSLGSNEIYSFRGFSYDLLVIQFNYYQKKEQSLINRKIVSKINRLPSLLVQFYRHLAQVFKVEFEKNLFPKTVEIILNSKSFFKIQKEEFLPIFYDPRERPVTADKFVILPSNYTTHNAAMSNNKWIYVDLTGINPKYCGDLREFIWYASGQIRDRAGKLHYLKEFLNWKSLYDQRIEDVILLHDEEGEFGDLFIYNIRLHFESKYTESGTLRDCLKLIRKFLKYYYEKYKISQSVLDILSLDGLSDSKGGNPLTDNDLKVLYQGFIDKEKKKEPYGRIFTIVFELFTYTNLRIGEILNLERNCLIYHNGDEENVEIKYLKKGSNKEYTYQLISKQIISLIEEALTYTNAFINNDLSRKYIFVHPYKRLVNNECTRINFYSYFTNIQKEKKNELENTYFPYNLRHTFINNVYREGIKHDLTLTEMAAITGNSFKTAKKYYRKNNEIDLYVEAMSKVTITDVDVTGEILVNENSVNSNQIVKEGLGRCKENACTYDLSECLTCNHFVTFLNRIPSFENLLSKYNKELETTQNEIRILEINIEKKLLGKYLSELYKLKKERET
jgi:integrase